MDDLNSLAQEVGLTSSTPSSQEPSLNDVYNEVNQGNGAFNGFCEKYVEQTVYGKTGLFPTAASAWDNYAQNGKAFQGTQGIQPGDLLYFAPDKSNGNDGHVGIYDGNNQFTSATYNGIKTTDLGQWQKDTGQQVLGFVPTGGQNGY